MGFNNSSLRKKRRMGVKGLVLAFEAVDTGSDFLNIYVSNEFRSSWILAFYPSSIEADQDYNGGRDFLTNSYLQYICILHPLITYIAGTQNSTSDIIYLWNFMFDRRYVLRITSECVHKVQGRDNFWNPAFRICQDNAVYDKFIVEINDNGTFVLRGQMDRYKTMKP